MKKSAQRVLSAVLLSLAMSANVLASDDDDEHHHEYSHHDKHYKKHGYHDSHVAYAKVLDVDPIRVSSRTPHTERHCWDERVSTPRHERTRPHAAGPMILGGIIGGVVGHQVDNHRRHDHTAMLVGTLVGAAIGHDMGDHDTQAATTVVSQSCRNMTHYERDEHIVGYRVTYRYRGQTFVTRTDYHPGPRIRVNVSATPVDTH